MRVLFFCPHSRVSGGVETIFMYANALVDNGHTVSVSVGKNWDREISWFDQPIKFNLHNGAKIRQPLLNSYDVGITYADGPDISTSSKKKVLYLQGFSGDKKEVAILNSSYDSVICTSKWLSRTARSHNSKNKTIVIPPGINNNFRRMEYNPKVKLPIVGSLFHTSVDKRFIDFTDAVINYKIKYNKYLHCFILSSYNISNIDLLDKYLIPYTLFIRPPKGIIPYIYSACHAWVAPSINEGFGLTPIEAMACGCPVIIANNKGLEAFVVNGSNALVYNNYKEISEQLNNIILSKQLTKKLRKGGYNTAERLRWKNVVNYFVQHIEDL